MTIRTRAGMRRDEAQQERRRLYMAGRITAAGADVVSAADAAAQRTVLGLDTAAVENSDAFAAASHTHTGDAITTLIVENRTSDPGTPETGRIWLRTDL